MLFRADIYTSYPSKYKYYLLKNTRSYLYMSTMGNGAKFCSLVSGINPQPMDRQMSIGYAIPIVALAIGHYISLSSHTQLQQWRDEYNIPPKSVAERQYVTRHNVQSGEVNQVLSP